MTKHVPEFNVRKSSNYRWWIEYGGPLFWLKYLFLKIFESIFILGDFRGGLVRFYSQRSKIYEFKMADTIWRTYFLAKIFKIFVFDILESICVLGVFGISDYESEVKLKKFMNPKCRIQYGGRTFWLKFMFLKIFDSICDLRGFRGL